MKSKLLILLLAAFSLFTACDQVEPLNSKRTDPPEPFDTVYTKVLLTEFTGHFCGECPPAAELAHELHDLYKGKVSILSIHAGGFANPTSKHPADYRTTVGNALNTYFAVGPNPIASINYKSFNGTILMNYVRGELEPKIQTLITEFSPVNVGLEAKVQGNNLNVYVSTTISKRMNFDHSLAVYITEDSIQSWQKDSRLKPSDNYNYYHNAVFRASFNGAFGEDFLKGNLTRRTVLEKVLTLPIDPKWNTKYLRAIALIIDNTTKEIIQVEEMKFK